MTAVLMAEGTAHAQAIQNRDTIIVDLRLQLHDHQKHGFGSKSESSAQLALELILEELEIEHAAETDDEDASSSKIVLERNCLRWVHGHTALESLRSVNLHDITGLVSS